MNNNNVFGLRWPICKNSSLYTAVDENGFYVYTSPEHCRAHLFAAASYLASVFASVPPRVLARYFRIRRVSCFDATFPNNFIPNHAPHIAALAIHLQDMANVVTHEARYSYADLVNLANMSVHNTKLIDTLCTSH